MNRLLLNSHAFASLQHPFLMWMLSILDVIPCFLHWCCICAGYCIMYSVLFECNASFYHLTRHCIISHCNIFMLTLVFYRNYHVSSFPLTSDCVSGAYSATFYSYFFYHSINCIIHLFFLTASNVASFTPVIPSGVASFIILPLSDA